MKRILIPAFIIISLIFVGCGDKIEETTKLVTESGDMIEILTPNPGDTFSWAAVTGNASVKQGLFYAELINESDEVLNRNSVDLIGTAPDTFEFQTGLSFSEEAPLQKAYIKAYTTGNNDEALMFSVHVLPGPPAAHNAIIWYFTALNTDDFTAAYEYLEPEGAAYPNFKDKEISFAARPENPEDLALWKKEGETLRVLTLRRLPVYALPSEDLFCYQATIEHTLGDVTEISKPYVFLKRQEGGTFMLYRPRIDIYTADTE